MVDLMLVGDEAGIRGKKAIRTVYDPCCGSGGMLMIASRSGARSPTIATYGVTTRAMLGVPVRITSPARTVVDCFRYRNKLGLDVALEALRDVVRSRKATVDEIMRAAAEMCRARTVLRTYLEALS